MNLSRMYSDYIESMKEEKERDPLRLFVSDIGKCPRAVGYRMMQVEKDPVSEQELINKVIMFDLANHIEDMLGETLKHHEALVAFQCDVIMPDRENWGGRFDFVADYNGRRIIECKTVHPGAFKFDLDYPEHHYQAACYDIYCAEEFRLDAPPMLVYFDRGGQNTPVEKEVDIPAFAVFAEMDKLEAVRGVIPELPPQLPKVLKERDRKTTIKLEPDYRCSRCDWSGTCNPPRGIETWAKRENTKEPYKPTYKADPDMLALFATRMILEVRN